MSNNTPTQTAKQRNRRMGKFIVSASLIDSDPASVLAVLDGCIVVRAEMLWASCSIEYVAISQGFDLIPEGEITPHYDAIIFGGKREWRRLP